jgi:hypothetical protein
LLRRAREAGYSGGKSAFYGLVPGEGGQKRDDSMNIWTLLFLVLVVVGLVGGVYAHICHRARSRHWTRVRRAMHAKMLARRLAP